MTTRGLSRSKRRDRFTTAVCLQPYLQLLSRLVQRRTSDRGTPLHTNTDQHPAAGPTSHCNHKVERHNHGQASALLPLQVQQKRQSADITSTTENQQQPAGPKLRGGGKLSSGGIYTNMDFQINSSGETQLTFLLN